jgi:molybdenum-dependent DNA-binding transcriptional regulator ModE
MELREMRAFVAVVEEGSLSAAARRLHVSQPALSQTVAGLEREFGVPLLTRSSTGALPTEAGRTLLAQARAVLNRHEQALNAMAAHTAAGGGALRIGIPLELPAGLLSEALADLAGAYPETKVQALPSGAADLGGLARRLAPPGPGPAGGRAGGDRDGGDAPYGWRSSVRDSCRREEGNGRAESILEGRTSKKTQVIAAKEWPRIVGRAKSTRRGIVGAWTGTANAL